MKVSFEYKIQKTAFIQSGKDATPVGIVEQDSREGDNMKMTVRLFNHLPQELKDLLIENPQVMNVREVKLKCSTVIVLPEGSDITI